MIYNNLYLEYNMNNGYALIKDIRYFKKFKNGVCTISRKNGKKERDKK